MAFSLMPGSAGNETMPFLFTVARVASRVKLSKRTFPCPGQTVTHCLPSLVVAVITSGPDFPGLNPGSGDSDADKAVTGSLSSRVLMPKATSKDPQPTSDKIATTTRPAPPSRSQRPGDEWERPRPATSPLPRAWSRFVIWG